MLTPSYSQLMDVIQESGKLDPRVASRYTVVLATAKRARQLTDGDEPLTYAPADRAVSIAVKEMSEGKLRVKVQADLMDGSYERLIKDQHKFRAITALSKDDLREDLKDDYTTARTYKLEDDDEASDDIFPQGNFADAEESTTMEETDEPLDDDFDIYEDEEIELEENIDEE